ncbi:MAG: class I SAM-dependent methyltransferase, partial [Flavisolibacter sp.]
DFIHLPRACRLHCKNETESTTEITLSIVSEHINQVKASEAFSKQSGVFDKLYGNESMIQYKRKRVRDHILQIAKPGGYMLELNCGTGEDALFFAQHGFNVHATDASEGMLSVLQKKFQVDSEQKVEVELCSFTNLRQLQNKGPFDSVYSNFGGLNCTGDLETVLKDLRTVVKPGGIVTLVIISKFCLWETMLVFNGKFKTAFRRFFSSKGRKAHIEGSYFKCWYYAPSFVIKHMKPDFDLLALEGLCTLVPPSYIEGFPEKHPGLFSFLQKKEERWKGKWPWKFIGDYYIISFRAKPAESVS